MSKTHRGEKGDGYEYWSRRYQKYKWFNDPGKLTKRLTKRHERRESQEEIARMVMEEDIEVLRRLS